MSLVLRRAQAVDAAELAILHNRVWPQDPTNSGKIVEILSLRDHLAHIAIDGSGQVLGYACGFKTLDANRLPRWEVDLLAVDVRARGAGVGGALVRQQSEFAGSLGANIVRAIVRESNSAARQTFMRQGFQESSVTYTLYLARMNIEEILCPDGCRLVPVSTFSYSGHWIEGSVTPEVLTHLSRIGRPDRNSVVGVMLAGDRSGRLGTFIPSGEWLEVSKRLLESAQR